jgi:hypothetical protein
LLSDIRGLATGPATFAPTNQLFGRRDTPIIIFWIFAAHQIGAVEFPAVNCVLENWKAARHLS